MAAEGSGIATTIQSPLAVIDVILPTLDEEAALPGLLSSFPAGYRAIVVDNGSTDRSVEIARAHGAVVISEPQRGFGAACWAGLGVAESDVVCFMDADGSLDPADLPSVSMPVVDDEVDLMLGARVIQRGAMPPHARVANRFLAFEVRRRTGAAITDIGPMRALRREALLGLGMEDRRFGWPLEMVIKASAAGWRLGEVPVPYSARSGRSKVTGTVKGTARAIRDMSHHLR